MPSPPREIPEVARLSSIGLPRRSTSAARMLGSSAPPDVNSSFVCPPGARRVGQDRDPPSPVVAQRDEFTDEPSHATNRCARAGGATIAHSIGMKGPPCSRSVLIRPS